MRNRFSKSYMTFFVIALVTIVGCKKEEKVYGCTDPTSANYNPSATDNDGSCKYEGNVTFWYSSDGTDAKVTIDNKIGYITSYYEYYDPTCGSTGCANFTLEVGSYGYEASSTWHHWYGTVTITANDCTLVLLQ